MTSSKRLNNIFVPSPGALHIKADALQAVDLTADYINGVPISSIFTLKTNQTFNHEIKILGCLSVKEPLIVRGLVNGIVLEHERENTVMVRMTFLLNCVNHEKLINFRKMKNIKS